MNWAQITDFPDYYVRKDGDIKSIDRYITLSNGRERLLRGVLLKNKIDRDGYCVVRLYKNKKMYNVFVHQIVGKLFVPNPHDYKQINHKDGNKLNNNDWNLEWIDNAGNVLHAYNNQLRNQGKSKEMYIHFKNREQKFYCLIPKNGRRNHIGYFNTEEEAIVAKQKFLEGDDPSLVNEKMN
jgi:hypothetical protein